MEFTDCLTRIGRMDYRRSETCTGLLDCSRYVTHINAVDFKTYLARTLLVDYTFATA